MTMDYPNSIKFTLHPFRDFNRTAKCLDDNALMVSWVNAVIFAETVIHHHYGSPSMALTTDGATRYPFYQTWSRNFLALPDYISELCNEAVERGLTTRGRNVSGGKDLLSETGKVVDYAIGRKLPLVDALDVSDETYVRHQKMLLWADFEHYGGWFPDLMDQDVVMIENCSENTKLNPGEAAAAVAGGSLQKFIHGYTAAMTEEELFQMISGAARP